MNPKNWDVTINQIADESLGMFVKPRTIAIVGATEAVGSVGRALVANVVNSPFDGQVFAVNPKYSKVHGLPCFPSLASIPAQVDLAVIAIPAARVPGVIGECVAKDVRGAIVISAGFREVGPAGAALEAQIRQQIAGSNLRIIGPNCLGVMSPATGLNATFASSMMRRGNVALLSQSGAMLTSILDWSRCENVGFSHVISIGSMLDVGWGDLIDFLSDDPDTASIVIYMESIGNARAFLSAAREVTARKPIIVIKAGRTEMAAKAAASHTGALVGNDDVLDVAFRRAGVVRVKYVSELFNISEVLAKQPRPKGPKLAIVTCAGGPAVLATDALIEAGGQLAQLSPATIAKLSQVLPQHWSHGNPIDILGDAGPERYARSIEIVAAAAECDGLLVILTPQVMTEPTRIAQSLASCRMPVGKPLLASWMGGSDVAEGNQVLNQAGIPTFPYPDSAVRAFQYLWQYTYNLRALHETPVLKPSDESHASQRLASVLLAPVLQSGRTLLTEPESKQLLMAYDIPTVETQVAASATEAVQIARRLGYPVVLKLYSTTITHKTDVGGVRLNLTSDDEVRQAFDGIAAAVERIAGTGHFGGVCVQPMIQREGYELIVGSHVDPQFGPVILFGSGGQLVEVFKDRALGLPPLTSTLARRMMEGTRIYRALQGVRGRKAVDLPALEQVLVRFSQLVVEHRRIAEIDINPLLAGPDGLWALDARVVLQPATCHEKNLPQSVIRPYPRQYVSSWITKDNRHLVLRPIRPEDEPLLARFHEMLSEQTVYARYAQSLPLGQRTAHERLSRLCFIDYDRQMALVAVANQQSDPSVVAVARLIKLHGTNDAEFAIVIADAYQRSGLGIELLSRLVGIARDEKLSRLVGYMSATNTRMTTICRQLGFQFVESIGDPTCAAILNLRQDAVRRDSTAA